MAIDTDERWPVEILVSDNRTVLLFAFVDCAVEPVRDVDGETYAFDLGFRENGTGVGCVDADLDGRRDLVGLRRETGGPQRVEWSRTIVRLDGTTAMSGPADAGTFHAPHDDRAIELLSTVSCGERRIYDALTEPRP